MTIAILRENTDLIWLDAVLQFSEQYTTSVTKHRIESGASITDHVIEENPTFNVSGVVSGVDFGATKPIIGDSKDVGEIGAELNSEEVERVKISTSKQSTLIKLLPDSLRQFLTSDTPPVVIMQPDRPLEADILISLKKTLIEINRGTNVLVNKRVVNKKELVTLVEFDQNGKIINSYKNCVMTSLSFKEDADSGYALYPEMSFEQVRFVQLISTTIPKNVAPSVKTKKADKDDKGVQQGKNTEAPAEKGAVPGAKGPVDTGGIVFSATKVGKG